MSVAAPAPLSQFPHRHPHARADTSSRLIAGLLTAALYALLALLAWSSFRIAPVRPATVEIIATLMPDRPERTSTPMPPPIPVHLIKPPAQSIAPPAFTIATDVPAAPLPPSAATSSPLTGGVPGGISGQGGSANGTAGSGSSLSGCWDAVWARSVRDRIGQFYYYPTRAREWHMIGMVMVHLGVRHNGRLDVLEILKSSGHAVLDDAASDMVRKAQPLPAIPDRMHLDRVDAEIPVWFGSPGNSNPTVGSCGG